MEIYDWNYSSPTTSTDPISNATGVALKRLLLNLVMDPSTINTNFTLKQGTVITVALTQGTASNQLW
jgi:hypothetical protein